MKKLLALTLALFLCLLAPLPQAMAQEETAEMTPEETVEAWGGYSFDGQRDNISQENLE